MAQVLSQWHPPSPTPRSNHRCSISGSLNPTRTQLTNLTWDSLQHSLKCNPRFSCLFPDNNKKQEQARKALESALGGKKTEFEKWDKEIKRREEAGGGGKFGGGGWFGWGRWFGGSDGDHFWQEAQQISLTILGIVAMFLIIAKGNLMLAVVLNPMLLALRGTRDGLTSLTLLVMKRLNLASNANFSTVRRDKTGHYSARESVVKKWGSD